MQLQSAELLNNVSNRIRKMVKETQESVNRPDNTAFTQQRLPAWQPMLSAGIVIPGFVIIGVAFIGIGVALYVTSQSIQVLEVQLWPLKTSNIVCFQCGNDIFHYVLTAVCSKSCYL